MNIDVNTSLAGHYTLYDENMNVLCETDNLITDWGMRRFVGDRSTGTAPYSDNEDGPARAFCSNFAEIYLGTGTSTPSITSWKLDSMVPLTAYSVSVHQATTGTTLSTDPNENMQVIFTNVERFKFNSSSNSYVIKEVGCNWTSTMSANDRYGIFSRATLPPSPVISVSANSVLFAKYKLTATTNCNKTLSSMVHYMGNGATTLPPNRTNVRRLPFYPLSVTGGPAATLNNGVGGNYGIDNSVEYVQPLFEDMGLNNFKYVGSGTDHDLNQAPNVFCRPEARWQDSTFGTSQGSVTAYKNWWLQFYRVGSTGGANPSQRYDSFTSTTSALSGNSSSIKIDNSPGSLGGCDYSTVISQNLNVNANYGRKLSESAILTKLTSNQWVRTIKFLFSPNELGSNITVFRLYPATLGNWSNSYYSNNNYLGSTYYDNTGTLNYGIVTALSAAYTPNPSHYVGFEYNFTFERQ